MQYIHRRNKVHRSGSKRLIRSFITTPVHHSLVRSTFPSNPSVCPILRVRPGLHDSGAGGTKPSVSHRGGTPRHVMTIRAMDFYCSSSRKGDSPPHTSLILFRSPRVKVRHVILLTSFFVVFCGGWIFPRYTTLSHQAVSKVLFVFLPLVFISLVFHFACQFKSFSPSATPTSLTSNYVFTIFSHLFFGQ